MEPDFDNMPMEQVNEYLRSRGYDPEQVGLRGKILVETLFENMNLRARIATLEAENARMISEALVVDMDDVDRLDAANARIAELEAANRWIPVGERLPEESGLYPVLFATSDKRLLPAIRHFDIGHGWDMPVGMHLKGIVYWRPLPVPPEVEK